MQSNTLKMRIVVCIFILALILSCNKKSDLENQITITINSIDRETKKNRINSFDTIVVRKEVFGIIRSFDKVAEYITDSTGSVKIKVNRNEGYDFMLSRKGLYGSENFSEAYTKEKLKDGQKVNIEVFSIENR